MLWTAYNRAGEFAISIGNVDAAKMYFAEQFNLEEFDVVAISEHLVMAPAVSAEERTQLSIMYRRLGDIAREDGDEAGAQALIRKAAAMAR